MQSERTILHRSCIYVPHRIRVLIGVRLGSPLTSSINIHTHNYVKTLAATSSQTNPEILAARVVVAHPRVVDSVEALMWLLLR
jgi:hypothetical protein